MNTPNPTSSSSSRRALFLATSLALSGSARAEDLWFVGRPDTTTWTQSSFSTAYSGGGPGRLPTSFDTVYLTAQNAVNVANQQIALNGFGIVGLQTDSRLTQNITLTTSGSYGIGAGGITVNSPTNLTLNWGNRSISTSNQPLNLNVAHSLGSLTLNADPIVSGINKFGPGLLTIPRDNSYGGNTSFFGGVIHVTSGGGLGNSNLLFAGGTLRYSPAIVTDYSPRILSSTGPISIDTNAQNVLYASPLAASNTGGLTKLGAATLLLSAENTYTGPTTVSAGTLQLFQNGRISATSPITINSGGSLLLSASDRWGNHTTTSSSAITVNSGGNLTTNDGSYNTLVSPTLNGGTILLNGGFSATFPALSFKGTLTVGGSQPSVINAGTGSFNAINIGPTNAPGTLTINVADATASPAADLTINAPLQNTPNEAATSTHPSGLTKTGPGTLTLAAANTYTGPTTVSGGTLEFGPTSAASAASIVSIASGATLRLSRSDIWGGHNTTSSTPITIVGTLATNNTYNTLVNPSLNGGTVLLNGGSSASFPALALKGTVLVSGSAPSVVIPGTGNFNAINIGVTATPGSTTFNVADVTANASPDLTINAPLQNTIKDDFSGPQTSGLTKSGAGTLVLAANNTYTGPTTVSAGTLQLGNGTAAGSLSGSSAVSVATGATLAVNRSDIFTFSTPLFTGSGGLTQMGPGTLILTANNTYTGPTIISGGTLQLGNEGTTGSVIGNITNHGILAFNRSASFTYSESISGTGSVIKLGVPLIGVIPQTTLTLTGASTYTGGTTIAPGGGALQIGNGGTTGSIVGNIINNSGNINRDVGLRFFRSDNVTFPGIISGAGGVGQFGPGVLTFTGDHTYTGGTLISAGTLQIGNGGTTGSIGGSILNRAAVIFNRSDNLSYIVDIAGTGSLTKSGPGTLTLSGTLAYIGNTSITAGKLILGSPLNTTTGDLLLSTNSSLDFATPRSTSPVTVSRIDNLTIPSAAIAKITTSPRGIVVQQGVLIVNSLSIIGTGFLDLTNNDLIVRNQPLASVRALVSTWLTANNGLPGTTGLGSSAAFYTPEGAFTTLAVYDNSIPSQTLTTFNGIAVTPTDVLVKYTYLGDTNLDGVVNAIDLSRLLQGLNGQGSGWNFGDINYDGLVNFTDLGRLQAALRGQGTPLSTTGSGGAGGTIPEPTSLALLSLPALTLLRLPRATSRGPRRRP